MSGLAILLTAMIAFGNAGAAQQPDAAPVEPAAAAPGAEDAPAEASADGAAAPAQEEPEAAAPERKFEKLPVEDLKGGLNTINTILMNGKFDSATQQQTFDDYYQKYYLPRWTDKQNLASLPAFRKELRISHLGKRTSNPAVHDHLNKLMLDFMGKLASGPYHPAVQLNAMLMIGDLNSVEQPVAPLPEAMTVMMAAIDDPKTSEALRAAALVGIERHVLLGGPAAEVRPKLVASLLKLAGADVPAGPAAEARQWVVAQALETLGALGAVGEGNAVFKAMLAAVGNAKLSFSTRAIAAEALGRLNYAGAAGINPVEAAVALGQFAMASCAEELRLVNEHGYPVSRRRMKFELGSVLNALAGSGEGSGKGIASLATEPAAQAYIGQLPKDINGLFDAFDDKKNETEVMDVQVGELQEKIAAWLKKKP